MRPSRFLLFALISTFLTGCAYNTGSQVQDASQADQQLVSSGQMKLSMFYRREYDRVMSASPFVGQSERALALAKLAKAARTYEDGAISWEDFEDVRREIVADAAGQTDRAIEADDTRRRAVFEAIRKSGARSNR